MTIGYSIKRHLDSGLIMIDQGAIHGWPVSYNPDDERFYVENDDKTAKATFSYLANAVQFCRKHAK